MTQPLALLHYKKLLPGSQLMHRLEDLGYRVQTVSELASLLDEADSLKPLFMILDMEPKTPEVCDAIAGLRRQPGTAHIPVIAITGEDQEENQDNLKQDSLIGHKVSLPLLFLQKREMIEKGWGGSELTKSLREKSSTLGGGLSVKGADESVDSLGTVLGAFRLTGGMLLDA